MAETTISCEECGEEFDVDADVEGPDAAECPHCGHANPLPSAD